MEFAVERSVDIAMAGAMGLHGFLPHSVKAHGMPVDTRGKSAEARGLSVVVCLTPWRLPLNAVKVRGHGRRAPPKRQTMYIPPISYRRIVEPV